MSSPEILTVHRWQSDGVPLCTIAIPVHELALRFGFPLDTWEEPGLGSATGFACRLESGLVVLLEEFAHARECLGARGPTIYVDATALVEHGAELTLANVMRGLRLSRPDISWVQTEEGMAAAGEIVRIVRERGGQQPVP